MNKFIPKNFKYKKIRKRIRTNNLKDFNTCPLKVGNYGLQILDNVNISSVVLEAARRSITRKLKRIGTLKINAFCSVPFTTKSLGVRMGKGVGSISGWVCRVRKGRILFELSGVSLELARVALKSAAHKLPVKTRFLYN